MMKRTLLATTAILGLSLAAAPAQAFDNLEWNWELNAFTNIDIDVAVEALDLSPDGMATIEIFQDFTGDVNSNVSFSGDYLTNDATELAVAPEGEVLIPLNGTIHLEGNWNKHGVNGTVNGDVDGFIGDFELAEGSIDPSGLLGKSGEYEFYIDMDGQVFVFDWDDVGLDFDDVTVDATTQMGTLVGDAVSIANFNSIQTETATLLDQIQVHSANNDLDGFGVSATASAGEIGNPVAAAVDLSATAISNYFSLEGAPGAGDNILVADLTQTTDANINASATAVQDLSGFNNVGAFVNGDLDAGVVGNLNATAIGNYSSMSFGPNIDLNLGE